VAISKSKVAALVKALNSADESAAKAAAKELDWLLYPNYGPGPRVFTAEESQRIRDAHYASLRGSAVLEPVLKAVKEGTPFARAYALTVLGAAGDPRVMPLAVEALNDPAREVRASAARCLFFFRDPATAPALLQRLDDPDTEVRCAAASTLGFIQGVDVVPELMALYERSDSESRMAALRALGQIGDPRSLQLARDALLDKDKSVRKTAKLALARYDWKRRHGE
jgi:HEAT repeat protein